MDNNSRRSRVSTLFILLLLCSVFVSPVMAGDSQETVVEDGVHLVKLSDSPTKLDHHFYDVDPTVNFVVDGNQYYWVRIGSVKASDLSKNDMANLLCRGVFAVATGAGVAFVVGATGTAEVGSGGAATPAALPLAVGALAGLIEFGSDYATKLCDVFETWFVTDKYRYVASDGTILIGIAKTNTAGIQELKKNGLDITKLTHLSSDGSLVPKTDL